MVIQMFIILNISSIKPTAVLKVKKSYLFLYNYNLNLSTVSRENEILQL